MMRWLIAVLLLLNLATLAWQWDALARWGWGPPTAREPERVLNQLRPEALKIETPAAFKQRMAAEAAASDSATAAASSAPDAPAPSLPLPSTPASKAPPQRNPLTLF